MIRNRYLLLLFCLVLLSCSSSRKTATDITPSPATISADEVRFTFLQLNDVYEISPLENGKVGGLARVATVRKKLLQEDPNLYTVLAGDFLNPSLIATLKLDGERIKGAHMIDVLNAVDIDLACFGNHEFDIKEHELQARMDESKFDWIYGNVWNQKESDKVKFTKNGSEIEEYKVLPIPGSDLSMGIFTVCLPANKVEWVHYGDTYDYVDQVVKQLEQEVDIIVGLTHLDIEDDLKLAEKYPQISLIMGGHDHDHQIHQVGPVPVAKADANAKTVYVHRMAINKSTGKARVQSELVKIDDTIMDDAYVGSVADKWNAIAQKSFDEMGFDPNEIVSVFPDMMDARETIMRHRPAPFGQLIARAISAAAPGSDATIFNSGSVRVDDVLKGNYTQYDVLRTLPFGGSINEAKMKGDLLLKILETAWANTGSGGFLQWDRIDHNEEDGFTINGKPIDANSEYRIAMTDFLLTGYESKLDFLTKDNPGILQLYACNPNDPGDLKNDIRKALIHYLKQSGR